jgi:hypothetical protein
MADRIEDGGPVHPIPEQRDPVTGAGICEGWHGMSLRDWFAGQALPTLLDVCRGDNRGISFVDHVAYHAYEVADAMLKARAASSPEAPHV